MLYPQILSLVWDVCAEQTRKRTLCLGHVFVVIPSLPLSQLKSDQFMTWLWPEDTPQRQFL